MPKFYCTLCGYSFIPRNPTKLEPPKTCPYCNKSECLVKEQTSTDILREV